jgi:phosphohistidine phosphatase
VTLLLVRHGIAMDRVDFQLAARDAAADLDGDVNDDFRPLTSDGIRKMKKSARGLACIVDRPALLISSPLTRARETAEILQMAWGGIEIAFAEQLRPDGKRQALATWLNSRVETLDEDPLIAMVGHEPQLSEFASWLLSGVAKSTVEIKKGGACLIKFPDRLQKSRGVLKWLVTPPLLRALK